MNMLKYSFSITIPVLYGKSQQHILPEFKKTDFKIALHFPTVYIKCYIS